MILKYKLLGNLIEFVDKLNKLKQYLELISAEAESEIINWSNKKDLLEI